ncbi:MAG: CoA pyrophosphatase [Dechloromonas sp.]|uniref:CoA pyrophosphatase n=1 Tax=Dechloromonas sp. CZR5 TaxID=2608630 RepID=UPI00123C7E07|nr:CoA pyrophosphatase [Dechloromonas sp. CZR5]MBL8403054.1 CoA pyrophosphatase [Dechloromonas sp.]
MTVDLDRLRTSLLSEQRAGHFVQEDGALDQPLTPAAVLFPIVLRDDGHTVLLTQRTAHLRDHAGQISFPGGRVEAHDQSPVDTALRETEEEIGLSRERVEIVGFLPEYRTGTGFRVTPVVALVRPPFDLQPDPFEVAEIFEVPLAFLIDPANHQQHSLHYRGALRHYFAMPYGDYFIWGATAGMIRSLSERLGLLQAP